MIENATAQRFACRVDLFLDCFSGFPALVSAGRASKFRRLVLKNSRGPGSLDVIVITLRRDQRIGRRDGGPRSDVCALLSEGIKMLSAKTEMKLNFGGAGSGAKSIAAPSIAPLNNNCESEWCVCEEASSFDVAAVGRLSRCPSPKVGAGKKSSNRSSCGWG